MRIFATAIALVILIAAVVPAGAAGAARQAKPVVIVFDTAVGAGGDKELAASATKALCTYLRESQRVEATLFDRESPTVLRAIMDKQLTADQVASYSGQQQRIGVAKALAYDYAAGAEVSIKDSVVQVKIWMARVDGGKKDKWEASGQASTGGGGDRGYENAMQSATSAAVISITRQAFLGLPAVPDKQPTTSADTTAIGADELPPPTPPSANDYAAQADASMTAGSLALAIQQYQQAVNADPGSAALRLKLASAYARKGLFAEATAELDRAATAGASAEQIAAARKEIESARGGQTTKAAPEPEPAVVKSVKMASEQEQAPAQAADPKSAVAMISQGDKLWRSAKPDEAAEAYRQAIKLDPTDWRSYERLALVDAAMSLFSESRSTLEQLAKVQPNPSAQTISNRYLLFTKVFEQWFTMLFQRYDGDSADYTKHIITRESYYSSIKGLGARLESMAKFMDALPVPEGKKNAGLHLSLACGLLSQAASSLQDYLETNSADSKSNADVFVSQAKKELDAAKKADANPVVVQHPVQPAPPTDADAPTESGPGQ